MIRFSLPDSIYKKIVALPEYAAAKNEVPPEKIRSCLTAVLWIAFGDNSWEEDVCMFGVTANEAFSCFDRWQRAGLFQLIPYAVKPIKNKDWAWLEYLPKFTKNIRAIYNREILGTRRVKTVSMEERDRQVLDLLAKTQTVVRCKRSMRDVTPPSPLLLEAPIDHQEDGRVEIM